MSAVLRELPVNERGTVDEYIRSQVKLLTENATAELSKKLGQVISQRDKWERKFRALDYGMHRAVINDPARPGQRTTLGIIYEQGEYLERCLCKDIDCSGCSWEDEP